METNWKMPKEGTVTIQYIPGEKTSSRLEGHRNLLPVVGFVVSLTMSGIFLIIVAWQANHATPELTKKGRRRR